MRAETKARNRLAQVLGGGTAVAAAVAVAMTMGPATASAQAATTTESASAFSTHRDQGASCGPVVPAYVEVNNDDLINVGKYTLEDGSNAFDVAIIFAANINYDGEKAQLHFNDRVQQTLDEAATQIRPLQERGIKVTLSVLGNHQGAGPANFDTREEAAAFATQVTDAVEKYDLDGVDIDDEYSEYGENGTSQPNDESIGWLIDSLREDMPNKIVSYYNIGPSSESLEQVDPSVDKKLSYIQNTDSETAVSLAERSQTDGYGVFMTYNLPDGNEEEYVSSLTQELFGQDAEYDADGPSADAPKPGACQVHLNNGVLQKDRSSDPGNGKHSGHATG